MSKFCLISQSQKGLSLIETLISLTTILVITASFHQLLSSFYEHYEIQEAIAETQQQGRVTSDIFWQEVRNTGLDPTGALFDPDNHNKTKKRKKACLKLKHTVEPILEASPTVFHFLADLNQDGHVDGSKKPDSEEHIRYEWVGCDGHTSCWKTGKPIKKPYTLYRDSGSGLQEVASDITAFKLEYYDEDGMNFPEAALDKTQRERIKRIVLSLTTRTANALNNGYHNRNGVTEIWLRNL